MLASFGRGRPFGPRGARGLGASGPRADGPSGPGRRFPRAGRQPFCSPKGFRGDDGHRRGPPPSCRARDTESPRRASAVGVRDLPGCVCRSRPEGELIRALGELPPRQRAVLVLRYFDDLSESEVASTLGCSIGTVKSTTARALEKMRALVPEREATAGTGSRVLARPEGKRVLACPEGKAERR